VKSRVCVALITVLAVIAAPVSATASAASSGCGETPESWSGTFTGDQYRANGVGPYESTITLNPVSQRVDFQIIRDTTKISGANGHDDWWIEKSSDGYQAVFRSDGGRGWGPISDFRLTAEMCDMSGHVHLATSASVIRDLLGDTTITTRVGYYLSYKSS
jgi:hypothetical protein